jgi:Rrf2 family protein
MKLSCAASYALHALAHLAGHNRGGLVPGHVLAAAGGIPPRSLSKVLGRLESAGVLQAGAGYGGGYRLARPAPDITLLEVVEAVDGPVRGEVPTDFATAKDGFDKRLARVCEGAAELVRGRLGQVRLSELVKG